MITKSTRYSHMRHARLTLASGHTTLTPTTTHGRCPASHRGVRGVDRKTLWSVGPGQAAGVSELRGERVRLGACLVSRPRSRAWRVRLVPAARRRGHRLALLRATALQPALQPALRPPPPPLVPLRGVAARGAACRARSQHPARAKGASLRSHSASLALMVTRTASCR